MLPKLKDKYNSDVSKDVFRVVEAYYKFYIAVQISQNFDEDMNEKSVMPTWCKQLKILFRCAPLYSRSVSL